MSDEKLEGQAKQKFESFKGSLSFGQKFSLMRAYGNLTDAEKQNLIKIANKNPEALDALQKVYDPNVKPPDLHKLCQEADIDLQSGSYPANQPVVTTQAEIEDRSHWLGSRAVLGVPMLASYYNEAIQPPTHNPDRDSSPGMPRPGLAKNGLTA